VFKERPWGQDSRGAVAHEHQKSAPIAGDKKVRHPGLAQSEQEIVRRVGRSLNPREAVNHDRRGSELVDQAASPIWANQSADMRAV